MISLGRVHPRVSALASLASLVVVAASGSFLVIACETDTGSQGAPGFDGGLGPDFDGSSAGVDGATDPSDAATTVDGSVPAGPVLQVEAGWTSTCALLDTGKMKCWGYNGGGVLSTGSTDETIPPTEVLGVSNLAQIAVSPNGGYSCGRTTGGKVSCWGSGGGGRLGDGTANNRLTPLEVAGISDVVDLAVSQLGTTCARTAAGKVFCWGRNETGQLGDGTDDNSMVPKEITGLTNVAQFALGYGHSCVLHTTGKVSCSGYRRDGQIGDGKDTANPESSLTFQEVANLDDAVELGAGYAFNCARRATGAVVCWGDNMAGQVGDDASDDRNVPTQVAGMTDAVELAVGYVRSCARRANGTVACWGYNPPAEYGKPVLDPNHRTPRDVVGLADVVKMDVGRDHACARQSSGRVVCWGDNSAAQLGDGTKITRPSPVEVLGLP